MADWKKLALNALLSDGRIDTKETNLVREAIFDDGRVDKSELEFLFQLRKQAESSVKVFDTMFFDAVKKHMLADGDISDTEARWLRKMIFADGSVDENEKAFLEDLRSSAGSAGAEFESLCKDALGG